MTLGPFTFRKCNFRSICRGRSSSLLPATVWFYSSSSSFCMQIWCLVCWTWAKCLSTECSWLTPAILHVNRLSKPGSSSKEPVTCLGHYPEEACSLPWDSSPSFSSTLTEIAFCEMHSGNRMGKDIASGTSALFINICCVQRKGGTRRLTPAAPRRIGTHPSFPLPQTHGCESQWKPIIWSISMN